MLVLSRKLNQEIVIGENVKITVLKIKGNTVRIGIEAPRDIHVLRGELTAQSEFNMANPVPEPEIAEFTVVFDNTSDEQVTGIDLLPFQDRQSNSTRQSSSEPKDSAKSISFRGKLPAPLQHNRLKEIASRLTSNSETTKA